MGDMLKKAYDDSMLDCPEKPMTSELKCPFCQQELDKVYLIPAALVCMNCHRLATKELWQALIQSQKDLEKLKERYSAREKKVLDW